jgi:mediator of RNA polymerase II transcription subunit 31
LKIQDLAQNKFFDDESFVNYLKYLQYWKDEKYSKYITFPHCLYFLDQLMNEKFRQECKKKEFTEYIKIQQGLHWQFYRKNREEEFQKK